MPYVVLIHATFDSQTDAQYAYDQTRALASNAKRAWSGTAGERTSWGGVYDEQADGSLVEINSWHIDEIDSVKEGKPLKGGTKLTLENTSAWDSTVTYPLNYDVNHIDKFWRSQTSGNLNSEPSKDNPDWIEVTTV